jgi:hypothetical protein
MNKKCPISTTEIRALKDRLQDLPLTARTKGTTLDFYEARKESNAGNKHFDLGCWLYYYSTRIGIEKEINSRIDCARRIFLEGIFNPGYGFFTAFDFGERQFDTIFEMGDSLEVINALRDMIPEDETGRIKAAFSYFGWPLTQSKQTPVLALAQKSAPGRIERMKMRSYLVTIRLPNGKNEYYECDAESAFDAKQKAGWAYIREGVVTDVTEVSRISVSERQQTLI